MQQLSRGAHCAQGWCSHCAQERCTCAQEWCFQTKQGRTAQSGCLAAASSLKLKPTLTLTQASLLASRKGKDMSANLQACIPWSRPKAFGRKPLLASIQEIAIRVKKHCPGIKRGLYAGTFFTHLMQPLLMLAEINRMAAPKAGCIHFLRTSFPSS